MLREVERPDGVRVLFEYDPFARHRDAGALLLLEGERSALAYFVPRESLERARAAGGAARDWLNPAEHDVEELDVPLPPGLSSQRRHAALVRLAKLARERMCAKKGPQPIVSLSDPEMATLERSLREIARRIDVGGGSGVGVAVQGHTRIEDLAIHDLRAGDAPALGLRLEPTVRDAPWAPVVQVDRARITDLEGVAIRSRVPLGRTPRWPVRVEDLRVARMSRVAYSPTWTRLVPALSAAFHSSSLTTRLVRPSRS